MVMHRLLLTWWWGVSKVEGYEEEEEGSCQELSWLLPNEKLETM